MKNISVKLLVILVSLLALLCVGCAEKSDQSKEAIGTESVGQGEPTATPTLTPTPTPSPTPVIYNHKYKICVPDGYVIRVDGIIITEAYRTGNEEINPEFEELAQYVPMPKIVEYNVKSINETPELTLSDNEGNKVEYEISEDGAISPKSQFVMSDERKAEAFNMVSTWQSFLLRDLGGGSYGLDTVRKYLIRDSYYWKLATAYANGSDITFISNHSVKNPAYSEVVVDNYIEYGEDCYSCRIEFTKNLNLTRTGDDRFDTIDMTVYFVNYDDTDNGVDDPHWAIASMVATIDEEHKHKEEESFDANGIRIEKISGKSFLGTMMIIKDPAQLRVGTVSNNGAWPEYGDELLELVQRVGAIGGINGGLYESSSNRGGHPIGVVVENGVITCNNPGISGLYMIGITRSNELVIKKLEGMGSGAFAEYVKENEIRDAVVFQEDSSDTKNHFVPLIQDGEAREFPDYCNGANPRTAIGQREDGAILLLVTDGRGVCGHLGASATEITSIMKEYGAVNAANLDGGSSTAMVYDGAYEQTSVTFYSRNGSWRLPTAFVVMGT